MTKKRSIISYEKLTMSQKKQLEIDFPEGFLSNLTTIRTPKNEVIDALIWEKEEIVYLVKVNKAALVVAINDQIDDDFLYEHAPSDALLDDIEANDDPDDLETQEDDDEDDEDDDDDDELD